MRKRCPKRHIKSETTILTKGENKKVTKYDFILQDPEL